MSSTPAETPDIQPAPPQTAPEIAQTQDVPAAPAPVAQSNPQPAPVEDDISELTSEEVHDRIMDFRLGLRNDIT